MVNFQKKFIQVQKDLRQNPRVEFHTPVTIMGLNEKGQIIDFSVSGFYVQVEQTGQLKQGQHVHLALWFPHEKNSTVIRTEIVRIEKNGFGCRFVDVDLMQYELLERSFDFLSTTLPIE